MNAEVLDHTENQVDVVLSQRVSDIHDDLDGIKKNAIDSLRRAIRVGENLVMAKEEVPHGQWGQWLRDNFNMTERTAQRYMKLYERFGKNDNAVVFENYELSQLYELMTLDEEELEDFIETQKDKGVDVSKMSTRAIQKAKKEHKEERLTLADSKNDNAVVFKKPSTKEQIKTLEEENAKMKVRITLLENMVRNHCTQLSRQQVLQRELVFRYAVHETCTDYSNVSAKNKAEVEIISLGNEFWDKALPWERKEINDLCMTNKK